MAKHNIGIKNGFWKGGRTLASNGYWLIRVGKDHHLSDVRGYAYEHRLVAEKKLGRKLRKGELVHHIDGNKQNNLPENIDVAKSIAHHLLLHRRSGKKRRLPSEANPTILCGCGCGMEFNLYDATGRPRKFVTGHNSHVISNKNRMDESS